MPLIIFKYEFEIGLTNSQSYTMKYVQALFIWMKVVNMYDKNRGIVLMGRLNFADLPKQP